MKVRLRLDGVPFDVRLVPEDDGWMATVDGETFPVRSDGGPTPVVRADDSTFSLAMDGAEHVRVDGRAYRFRIEGLEGVAGAEGSKGGLGPVHAPMSGKLDSIDVEEGQEVAAGDVLFVLEAMKMRNQVKAPATGIVKAIKAKPGQAVDTKTVVLVLAEA